MEKFRIYKLIVVAILMIGIVGTLKLSQNYIKDEIKDRTNIVINNENVTTSLSSNIYIDEKNTAYLSFDDIDNFFDENICFDSKYNIIITGSKNKIASFQINQYEIDVNGAKKEIKSPAIKMDDMIFLPFSDMGEIYNLDIKYIKSADTLIVKSLNREEKTAKSTNNINVKYRPTVFSKTIEAIDKDIVLTVASEVNNWYKVTTPNGNIGYIRKQDLTNPEISREKEEQISKIDGNVSMIWEYFSEYGSAPDRTGTKLKGVNVVSPTFFTLVSEGKGKIDINIGDEGLSYINWAHNNGYQVWPSISNNSYIDTTSEILNDYKLRQYLINQIVKLVKQYNLDGINIDFEYMYVDDKDLFTRFIIELAPRLNEIGAVLSVDVTAPDGGENWSMCYDRHRIAKAADYIVYMAYDQHGISSDEAGTTAGYDWIEVNLKKFVGTQEEIEPNKIILGIPFYARLWEEKNGTVSNIAIAMKDLDGVIPNGIGKTWDDDLKQYYVEFSSNGGKYKLWIEDIKSIEAKLSLIEEYGLGGAAYWQKDMESQDVWSLISKKLGIN